MYYLRSKPAAEPIKFTLDVESLLKDAGNIQIQKKKQEKTADTTEENWSEDQVLKKKFKKFLPPPPGKEIKCDIVKDEDGNEYEVCLNCGS